MKDPKKQNQKSQAQANDRASRVPGTALGRDLHADLHNVLLKQWKNPPADGRYINAAELAAMLGGSKKRIQRHIRELQDRRGLPIETIQGGRGGYRYTEEVTEFPAVKLCKGELFVLTLGVLALATFRGTASEKVMRTAVEKLFSVLDADMTVDMKKLEKLITFRPGGFEAPIDLELFETVTRALLAEEEITFTHTKPDPEAKPLKRHAQPRHLASVGNAWYLFANDLDRDHKIRRFALTRVTDLKSTRKKFVPKKKFNIDDHLDKSLGIHTGGDIKQVRLHFSRAVRTYVLERHWYEDQKLTGLPDGGLEMTMEIRVNPELYKWIRQWGSAVKVIEPSGLREVIAEDSRRVLALYGE